MQLAWILGSKCLEMDKLVTPTWNANIQGSKDISKYIANAKAKNSVLTLFVSYKIQDHLKKDAIQERTRTLRDKTLNPDPKTLIKYFEGEGDDLDVDLQMESDSETEHVVKKSKIDFSLSVYSVHFDDEKKLAMKTLHEVNNPDGLFIVVETSFDVPPV